jgi:hypothetical protein
MEVLLQAHRIEAFAMIAWMFVVGVWGVGAHFRGQRLLTASYKRALWVAAALPIVQAILGIGLLLQGYRPDTILHVLLYGTLAPFALPLIYVYVTRRGQEHPALAFGLACLFLVAFLLRAVSTA